MSKGMSGEQTARERECIHRARGVAGDFYSGAAYLARLQRLRGADATKMARNVGAFFWSDAPRLRIWLCKDCASDVGL